MPGIVGAKVQEFEQLALELVAGRHKALVFSQFTDFLKLLGERLDDCGISCQYSRDASWPCTRTNAAWRMASWKARTRASRSVPTNWGLAARVQTPTLMTLGPRPAPR